MLEIDELDAGYAAVDVLHGISIQVEAGEIVAILGPNGAGKSTLLKTIVGLIPARKGEIRFDGKEINGLSPEAILGRGLALVPEGREIFTGLTVLENLQVGAYLEPDQKEVARRIADISERFPVLSDRQSQIGVTLSGGEQQQLAIGRALMSAPKMLMLDEPSLGLAPGLVKAVMDLLREIRDDGLTVLLVEQNIHQALEISDRVYVMASGRIQFEGDAVEFRERGLELERAYLGADA
jgi:branched-chain amino acid transport system ATP-binding protein